MIRKKQLRKQVKDLEDAILIISKRANSLDNEVHDLCIQLATMGKYNDSGWYRSSERRVAVSPEGALTRYRRDTVGSEDIEFYRPATDSLWIRTWAQKEWRRD